MKFYSLNIPNLHLIEDAKFNTTIKWRIPNEFEQTDALSALSSLGPGANVTRIYTLAIENSENPDMPFHIGLLRNTSNPNYVVVPGTSPTLVANQELFIALDRALSIASTYQIGVILPLIDKWQWWGGIPAFCRIHGAPESQFFTNKSIVSNFLNVVRYVATRQNMFTGREYRHEPFIYAWETGNELSAGKERVPTEWTLAVTRLLKNELAASQLIFDGSYSLYGWDDAVLNDASIDGFTGHYYQQNPVEAPRTVNRVAGIIFGFSAVFLLVAVWLVHRSKISIDTFKRIPFFAEAPADANQEDSRPDEALMDSYEPRQSKVAKWQSLGGLILISIIILTSFALSINQSPKYLPSLDYASRFQLDHDLIVTQHKKLFFVGEYGLDSVPVFERLLEAVENSNAMGALIWSLRFRSRNGGFYSHDEGGGFISYHYPGFPDAKSFGRDELKVMDMLRNYSKGVEAVPYVAPVWIYSAFNKTGLEITVSLKWRGSVGARNYTLQRALGNQTDLDTFEVVGMGISDAVFEGSVLFTDVLEFGGIVSYRVAGVSNAGIGKFSEILAVKLYG